MTRRGIVLAILSPLFAVSLLAQTSGGLVGRVTDTSGAALPGVTVEVRSPALQGTRATTTEVDGSYRFALLPPGEYAIAYALSGFAPASRHVTVALGRDTTSDVMMKAGLAESITVSGGPVVDTTSTEIATNFNERAIETLPTQRNYSAIVQIAPGVASDANPGNNTQSTISVYGSSGAENAFYIDGVNTTNMEYGFQGKELNFEFISEVDVKTGGYEAEFGRATGGIINVITKSGGNQFSGDAFGYYDNDSLQSNPKSVVSIAGTQQGFTRKDFGADLGGFIMRDRLWFFGAYDGVRNTIKNILPAGPQAGQIAPTESRHDLGSAKLTYNLAPSHSLVATFLQDPRVDTGAINDANHPLIGDPSTYLGREDFGGRDYALRYDGSFFSKWVATAQIARHREANSVGPASSAGDQIEYLDAANGFFQTGGIGLIQDKSFNRKHYAGSLMRFLYGHEVKGGVEYETDTAQVTKRMSGGQQVTVFSGGDLSKPIYSHFYWTTPDATVGNAPISQLVASPEHKVTTAYLQDRWTITDRFTLSAGVRWDRQEIFDASGVKQIDMKKDLAPRLGFIFDPSGMHRSKIYGSYGRFYEELPMDLVIRSFSYERQPRIINYSRTSNVPDPNAEAELDTKSAILGGFTEPADPNLHNQYLTEWILGGEQEVAGNLSVGVKGIYRSYGRVIEDFLCQNDGTYCIGNPGEGIMKQIWGLDYATQYAAPKAKRSFKGVELTATRRFANNWQAMASYLYSRLEGNYDGEYAPFTNIGADPNISAAYDYFDFFTNGIDLTRITNRGPLSNDRRHQFKTSGLYQTPFKLSVGLSAYFRSGTPLTRYGYSDAYNRYEFFLTTRGAEGRTPDTYDADLHLGYPIDVSGAKVNLLLDVFNLFNTQRPILLDERWGFDETANKSSTPANANYLQPVLRTPPTSARIGVRVTF